MARRAVSNPLALAVLACLAERPMYPYEITSTLRERGKEQSIRLNYGSLYAVIKSLERHGFVAVQGAERAGNRPERTVYAITDTGRDEARDWLSELLSVPGREYPDFEAGLSLMPLLPPGTVLALLRDRLTRLDAELAELDATARRPEVVALPELFIVEFHYHVAMKRAERTFVEGLIDRLADRSLGGYEFWEEMQRSAGPFGALDEARAEVARKESSPKGSEPIST